MTFQIECQAAFRGLLHEGKTQYPRRAVLLALLASPLVHEVCDRQGNRRLALTDLGKASPDLFEVERFRFDHAGSAWFVEDLETEQVHRCDNQQQAIVTAFACRKNPSLFSKLT